MARQNIPHDLNVFLSAVLRSRKVGRGGEICNSNR